MIAKKELSKGAELQFEQFEKCSTNFSCQFPFAIRVPLSYQPLFFFGILFTFSCCSIVFM